MGAAGLFLSGVELEERALGYLSALPCPLELEALLACSRPLRVSPASRRLSGDALGGSARFRDSMSSRVQTSWGRMLADCSGVTRASEGLTPGLTPGPTVDEVVDSASAGADASSLEEGSWSCMRCRSCLTKEDEQIQSDVLE